MAVPAHVAFAEHVPRAEPLWAQARAPIDLELMGLLAGLFVLVGIGAMIALKMRSLAKTGDDVPVIEQTLEHYQDLFDRGLLDPQEFERIRASIQKQQPPAPPAKP